MRSLVRNLAIEYKWQSIFDARIVGDSLSDELLDYHCIVVLDWIQKINVERGVCKRRGVVIENHFSLKQRLA